MSNSIRIKNIKDIQAKDKAEHEAYVYSKQEVTSRKEFNQCYVAVYTIPPQKANYPMHSHENNTEVFYILTGKGGLQTADGIKKISAGDFIICPPGEESAHKITNTSETESLVYIDFDTTNSPDIVHYPDSGKTGVIIHNQSSTFFRDDSKVDYYEGE